MYLYGILCYNKTAVNISMAKVSHKGGDTLIHPPRGDLLMDSPVDVTGKGFLLT